MVLAHARRPRMLFTAHDFRSKKNKERKKMDIENDVQEKKRLVSVYMTEKELKQIKAQTAEPKASTAVAIAARKGAGIKVGE